jgi:hypothetical protein
METVENIIFLKVFISPQLACGPIQPVKPNRKSYFVRSYEDPDNHKMPWIWPRGISDKKYPRCFLLREFYKYTSIAKTRNKHSK